MTIIDKYLLLDKDDDKKTAIIKNLINHMIDCDGSLISISDIKNNAKKQKITATDVDFIIDQLKKKGLMYEKQDDMLVVI